VRNVGPRPGSTTATTTFERLGTSKTIPSKSGPRPATLTSSPGAIVSTGKRYRAGAPQRSAGRYHQSETTPAFRFERRRRRWWISMRVSHKSGLPARCCDHPQRIATTWRPRRSRLEKTPSEGTFLEPAPSFGAAHDAGQAGTCAQLTIAHVCATTSGQSGRLVVASQSA
jgi:hypothetical protein